MTRVKRPWRPEPEPADRPNGVDPSLWAALESVCLGSIRAPDLDNLRQCRHRGVRPGARVVRKVSIRADAEPRSDGRTHSAQLRTARSPAGCPPDSDMKQSPADPQSESRGPLPDSRDPLSESRRDETCPSRLPARMEGRGPPGRNLSSRQLHAILQLTKKDEPLFNNEKSKTCCRSGDSPNEMMATCAHATMNVFTMSVKITLSRNSLRHAYGRAIPPTK